MVKYLILVGFVEVGIEVVFEVNLGEMLDFGGFCRSWYRTQNGGRGVGTSDMPFLASGCLS